VLGRRRKKKRSGSSSKQREGSACVCNGLKTAQFPDTHHHHHPLQIKLVCGHEGLAPRHHHRPYHASWEESWCARARVFWGRRLWNNFVSHHLLLQWFHNAAAPTFYSVRFKNPRAWHDEGAAAFIHSARRNNCAVAFFHHAFLQWRYARRRSHIPVWLSVH